MRDATAEKMKALSDTELAAQLRVRAHAMLGEMEIEGGRGSFPMTLQRVARLTGRRLALIGDAAHAFPPIGAQGLNLGLRDGAEIVRQAKGARDEGDDFGGESRLAAFAAARRPDIALRTAGVGMLKPVAARALLAGRCGARARARDAGRRLPAATLRGARGPHAFSGALAGFPPRESLRKAAMSRKCSRAGWAGVPNHRAPAGTSFIRPATRRSARPRRYADGRQGPPDRRWRRNPRSAGAGNAGLRDDDAMAADDDIMADLNQIVDLGAFADNGVAIGAAIDGGAGADLDIVLQNHAADLRHFEMSARAHGEAEAILADVHAGVDNDPIADQRADEGGAWRRSTQSRPMRTPGPITALAPISVPAPISASGPMTAPGSTMTPDSNRALG